MLPRPLTPFTSEASIANRDVSAPVELLFLSYQLISCRNMAENVFNRRRCVSLSPANDNVNTY